MPVTVVTPVGNANGLTFTYLDAPSLTAVNPASGPTGGGIDVTITGANLATTQEVTFDNTPRGLRRHLRPDDHRHRPAPPRRRITITVSTLGGSTGSTYTYLDGPAI
ncbi:hypothetical protein GCM10020000_78290 [Streptomyces olivoverticillatus]